MQKLIVYMAQGLRYMHVASRLLARDSRNLPEDKVLLIYTSVSFMHILSLAERLNELLRPFMSLKKA